MNSHQFLSAIDKMQSYVARLKTYSIKSSPDRSLFYFFRPFDWHV